MAKKQKEEPIGPDALLVELEKKYGVERADPGDLVIVSTGSLQLDQATNIGGTALGKFVEIFGENSCGKSTCSLHVMKEYQKAFPEKKVALLDFEHSFDRKYAMSIGVDVDNLLIYQPDYQEVGYDLALGLIEKELVSCIVIDSQTAATPKAIIDGEMGDATISLQARNNSKFCAKVKGMLDRHGVALFVISQIRDAIGSMGESTITTGGKAIRFYADMRWKVWKMNDKVKEQNKTTFDIIKNKLGNPFGQAKVNVLWGVGYDTVAEIIDYAVEFKIFKLSGSWYSHGENKIGQGMDQVKQLMTDNPDFFRDIKEQVLKQLNGN